MLTTPSTMKRLFCLIAIAIITFGAMAQKVTVNERTLTNTLKELNLELKTLCDQMPETQQAFNKELESQHQRMIDVITRRNRSGRSTWHTP